DPWAWMVAAEAAVRTERFAEALEYYRNVRRGGPDLQTAAAHGRAEMYLQLGRWEQAESEYRAATDADPNNLITRRRLADFYNLAGQRDRAVPIMQRLIGTTAGTLDDLFYLGDVDHGVQLPDNVHARQDDANADILVQIALGNEAMAENRNEQALRFFNHALTLQPNNPDAIAGLGQATIHLDQKDLAAWRRRVSGELLKDPGVLSVLGQLAERELHFDDAVNAFARVAIQRPGSRIAWHRLGLSLSRVGRTDEATLALARAQELQQLALWLDDLFQHREHVDLIHRVVTQLASMGRTPEAAAWCRYVLQNSPQTMWAQSLYRTLTNAPESLLEVKRETAIVSLLDSLTGNDWSPQMSALVTTEFDSTAPQDVGRPVQFSFVDEATKSGLSFVHHSARDRSRSGARIIETTGGGVGVIDYDADGWPDVYFPQGAATFPVPQANPETDRLFRNRRGLTWDENSSIAGICDSGFGQGIAAGDFDNDGFCDLYIANYGVNQLLHNEGDGTFIDVTPNFMQQQPVWTTSCVIADLNADGHPDLFDVTYCRGANVETLICEQQGKPRSCSPRAFSAETDRLWLSTGDGRWEESTNDGLDLPDGLGLGVVAFRSAPEEPLTLFVANDEAPNYWLIPRPLSPDGRTVWGDLAPISGLAVDADGKPQACMGIAADDMDGNGLIDLFVTNFYQESNTLYAAVSPGLYVDRTRLTGLREPSWNQLGFGTQFIDADLDSWPDLIVANGHIDDLSSQGQPFEMPVQFFSNSAGRFTEVQNKTPLPPALGRGMARLDWNRDGREDVVIVNQESPVRLLTNANASPGRSLRLQFRATSSARDAIGTIVRIQIGERTLTHQLTAGDGYMASNERQLVIGLGEIDRIPSLEIFWPGGVQQQCKDLRVPGTYLIVEQIAPFAFAGSENVGPGTETVGASGARLNPRITDRADSL
ncbi:MAG: VCBS repeat-containing protein, partial [Fuerstia sp.]|nr:VCBS repeat-containing protein [Fuerstiella sp.]